MTVRTLLKLNCRRFELDLKQIFTPVAINFEFQQRWRSQGPKGNLACAPTEAIM